MGRTSTRAKADWNASHYTQVKVSVKPETAEAFKAACAVNKSSMAGVLTGFMLHYAGVAQNAVQKGYFPNLATRRSRKAAMRRIILELGRILDSEGQYMENMPENLRTSPAFDSADECTQIISEALDLLESAY